METEPQDTVTADLGGATGDGDVLSIKIKAVPWFRQFRVVSRKNALLLWRRPITLIFMCVSSILSVLLTFPTAQNVNFDEVPLTSCGTADSNYYINRTQSRNYDPVPLSYNQSWMNGLAVACLVLGPMTHAIACFLLVHDEFQSQMLGVLRGLGLRDSVFWLSWYATFMLTSLVNSLGGGIVAAIVPLHAYENIYFAGVFGSFFLLNLALVSCSFFAAALLSSSRRGAVWLIIIMLFAPWIPQMTISFSSYIPSGGDIVEGYPTTSPVGLFWVNSNTTSYYQDFQENLTVYAPCDQPILTANEGAIYKTEEEQQEVDEWFVGCFATAGFTSTIWSPSFLPLHFIPYTHFAIIWGNMLGFTGMPNRKFTSKQASMSPEALAIASLPTSPSEDNAKGTDLFLQGSTIDVEVHYNYNYNGQILSNCPASNLTEYFCFNLYTCASSKVSAPLNKDSPSVLDMMGFLLALSVFYALVAAFWAIVFPGANGAPQKAWFWLLPSYWIGGKSAKNNDDTQGSGIVITNVGKTFGDMEALKSVSLQMEQGEVTALLGHNGAGKTTLSKILSCEIAPTHGDVSIFGHSVTDDPYAVRQLIGVCKQEDYLYPKLSAREHLELFAGLRGVAPNDVTVKVQDWLESVDLATVQNQFSSGFSGGMKRRLSVACSTIGDRPLIILDEPTTGMDPVSRRFVWRHIDAIKKGRVILMTTHAMEEADLLSESVAIMKRGEVAACGTPLELKSEYGSALQFSLLVSKENVDSMKSAILIEFGESMEWVQVDAGEAGNISVNISKIRASDPDASGVKVEKLTDFVAWLESDQSMVEEYGFCNSSLEEVFLKVTESNKDEEADDKANDTFDVCCKCCFQGCISCCLRGPCSCCCCPKPHEENNRNVVDAETAYDEGREIGGDSSDFSSFKPNLSVRQQTFAIIRNSFARGWTGKGSIGNWIFYLLICVGGNLVLALYAAEMYDANAAFSYHSVAVSFVLLNIVSPLYADRQSGMFYLMRTQGLLKASYILSHAAYAWLLAFTVCFITLIVVYVSPLFRDPNIGEEYTWNDWSIGDPPRDQYPAQIIWWSDEYNGQTVELYASRGPGHFGFLFAVACVFSITAPGAAFASAHIPGHKFALIVISFAVLVSGVLPLIFYFLAGRFNSLQEQVACERSVCATDTAEFDIGTISNNGREFLNCVGLQVSIDYLGALCQPSVSALLPQFGVFSGLTSAFMARIIFTSDPPEYVDNVLIPAIGGKVKCSGASCNFPRALQLFGQNMGWMILGAFLLLWLGYAQVTLFTFPSATAMKLRHHMASALRLLRHSKEPDAHQTGTSEDRLVEVIEEESHVMSIMGPLLLKSDFVDSQIGSNARNSALSIADHSSLPRADMPPVLAYKLSKVYPSLGGAPPKVALDSLDLHVPRGQVLGLLGKNGAGKTTAMKILSNSHEATSGVALIAGYDVSCETIEIFERMGNCPQFDLTWANSSVKHHLEFFARLKGLPSDQVKDIARSIATAVGLGAPEVYTRHAGALSGGMRRRLSIAISLIGAPTVLLLDEPSTGLDPSTRNSIWKLMKSFSTEERAVIITTHMMVEADVLCNRIAIVSQGRLKVIASQQHLKDRFGAGYLLQLNLDKSSDINQEKAMTFVRERLHKDAELQAKQAKTLHISLPRDVDLTATFRALYSSESATDGHINQFLLSQSSLEDVFIAIAD